MAVDLRPFNILERLICDQVDELQTTAAPRLLVRRLSISSMEMPTWFAKAGQPMHSHLSRLLQTEGQRDWKQAFHLDDRANRVERDVLELDFGTYCELKKDSQQQIVFAFSLPVAIDETALLYGTWSRGGLWARGYLCHYEGTFESPGSFKIQNLWQS